MRASVIILFVSVVIATGFKVCSNALFVEGHPHSHTKPVSVEKSQRIGSFISELQPSEQIVIIKGKKVRIERAWVEYRTRLTHFLIWFPKYVKTEGVHVTVQLNEIEPPAQIPFWLSLKNGRYTYLSDNQFTGMSEDMPQDEYEFLITDRKTKEQIGIITIKK